MRHLYFKIVAFAVIFSGMAFAVPDHTIGVEGAFNVTALDEEPYNFTLKDLEGKKVSLGDFKDSKVVVLNFWASWCSACKKEMPSLNSLEGKYKDKGLKVVAVAEDSKKRVSKYVDGKDFVFTVLIDPYGTAMGKYKILALPETFIISDGRIIGRITGGADFMSEEAQAYFMKLLNM